VLPKKLLVEEKTYLARIGTLLSLDIRLITALIFIDILLDSFWGMYDFCQLAFF